MVQTAYEVAHDFNYWELGDYIREKVGLEKLGPPRWKGEPVPNTLLESEARGLSVER